MDVITARGKRIERDAGPILLAVRSLQVSTPTVPLHIPDFYVRAGERVLVWGLNDLQIELLSHTLTGRFLPAAGEVMLFGRNTKELEDVDTWMRHIRDLSLLDMRQPLMEEWPLEVSLWQEWAMDLNADVDEAFRASIQTAARALGLTPEALLRTPRQSSEIERFRARFVRSWAKHPRLCLIVVRENEWPQKLRREFGRILRRWPHVPALLMMVSKPQGLEGFVHQSLCIGPDPDSPIPGNRKR